MTQEIWKPVAGYEGIYEVSDAGRVRSLPRRGRRSVVTLVGSVDRDGYRRVILSRNRKKQTCSVHHLVLLAFIGPRPNGQEACHNDGDPSNNSATNLRWDTHSANTRDKVLHGTHPSILKTHCPRGHEMAIPNLVPGLLQRLGKRACLSCKRAKGYMSTHGGDLQVISDRYYSALNFQHQGART